MNECIYEEINKHLKEIEENVGVIKVLRRQRNEAEQKLEKIQKEWDEWVLRESGWIIERASLLDERDKLQKQVKHLKKVLVHAAEPLEAIKASVVWEITDSIMTAIKDALTSIREAL